MLNRLPIEKESRALFKKSHPQCLLVPLLPFGARSGAVPRIGVWRAFEFEPSHSYVRAVSGF